MIYRNTLCHVTQILLLCIFIAGCSDSCTSSQPEINPEIVENTAAEISVHKLVNEYRISKELDRLKLNELISEVARRHSQNMADGKTPFGHEGFSGRSKEIRKKLGGNATAENVAYGYSSAKAVVKGWINSDGHRKNIEGNYTLTGIGIAYDEDSTVYYTQIFLNR